MSIPSGACGFRPTALFSSPSMGEVDRVQGTRDGVGGQLTLQGIGAVTHSVMSLRATTARPSRASRVAPND